MKKLLKFVVIPVLATALTAMLTVTGASADSDSGEFRWLAAAGLVEFGLLCALGPPPCPDAAMASNGDMIEMTGEGTLEIDDGEPEDVSGGGSYLHTDASGTVLDVGTFTATKLKSFESFGGSSVTPTTWRLGEALIRIRMVSDVDGETAKATLLVGCILPSPIEGPPPADLIEGIRLKVKGGQNFKFPPPVSADRSTLFIQLDDDDDDDDDDD